VVIVPKVAVVGVGNKLFGDDGVGSLVAEILGVCVRSESVDVLVRETLDTTVIHVFEDYDVVIFIDAIRKANVEKPALYHVDLDAAGRELEGSRTVDPHSVDVVGLAMLAHLMGGLKAKVYLLGMPVEVLDLGAPLSRRALNAIPLAIKIVEWVLGYEAGSKGSFDLECINDHLKSLGESSHYNPVG
jgi:hydrogenase maturation protease